MACDRLKKAPAAERMSLISNGSGSFGYTQVNAYYSQFEELAVPTTAGTADAVVEEGAAAPNSPPERR
jgi:hypothetical protein